MKFLNELISEFRPRLAPKDGLQPLDDEDAKKLEEVLKRQKTLYKIPTEVFMTEGPTAIVSESSQYAGHRKTGGEVIDGYDESKLMIFSMQSHVPISHTDVHRFIQEKCAENLFLININNEAKEI